MNSGGVGCKSPVSEWMKRDGICMCCCKYWKTMIYYVYHGCHNYVLSCHMVVVLIQKLLILQQQKKENNSIWCSTIPLLLDLQIQQSLCACYFPFIDPCHLLQTQTRFTWISLPFCSQIIIIVCKFSSANRHIIHCFVVICFWNPSFQHIIHSFVVILFCFESIYPDLILHI